MPDVFVSYARSTAEKAHAIAAELTSVGYDVWSDKELPVHRTYAEVIEKHLRDAKAVLVIWSEDAARSKWVRAEADLALETDKLVQLTLDGAVPPLPFNQIECANLVGWTGDPTSLGWRKVLSSIEQLTEEKKPVSGPELRHLTLLSCNLVQSSNGKLRQDPEAWHKIATRYREKATEAVEQFDGNVAKALGYRIVACFGYPNAVENSADRAARAGLSIIETLRELNKALVQQHADQISVQVGIHTGTAVVSLDGDDEQFGDMPEVAAQAQRAAAPDSVMITSAARELLPGIFQIEESAIAEPHGNDKPLQLYRVISYEQGVGAQARVSEQCEQSPFVGRHDELQLPMSRWSRVQEGRGQMILLTGEPGMGKTRLTSEFAARLPDDEHIWLQCGGDQLRMNSPFYAVIQTLEQAMDAAFDETAEQRIACLEKILAPSGVDLEEAIPLFADMLKLELTPSYAISALSPDQQRQKVLESLALWLLSATSNAPLVLAIEDLHWLDPSSLELVQILVEQGATAPLFLLCTARTEFRPPWSIRAHHAQITLDRLSNSQIQALVEGVDEGDALNNTIASAVIERASGVPLFAEELARLMIDRGESVGANEIPTTLRDSLAARLDRLGPARQIAQLGAVLGRSFSYDLILAVSQLREAELRSRLQKLTDAELVYIRGRIPNAQYEFKHGLIQDAAYEALLTNHRRELHARVAETILGFDPAQAEEHPEILAGHWSRAGEARKAISAWTKAGKLATSRFAYEEAAESFRQALALLDTQTDLPDREKIELQLQGFLVSALRITRGYSAEETKAAAFLARQLAEKLGDVSAQFKQTNGEWMAASSAGDYPTSRQQAEKLVSLAQKIARPREFAMAYRALLTTRLRTGDLAGAEQSFASGVRYFESEDFIKLNGAAAQTYGNAAINALIMGNETAARTRIQVVHNRIRTSKNPFDLAFSHHMSGLLDLMLGDPVSAEKRQLECIERSTKGGYPQFSSIASIALGRSRAEMGHPKEGLELIQDGLACLVETGNRAAITQYLTWLAATHAQCGFLDLALKKVDEALTINPHEISYRAESLRIRAEFHFERGNEVQAHADLQNAIDLAESIGARLYLNRALAVLHAHSATPHPG